MSITVPGANIVLPSKTPELVEQEFWGLLMAHYAIRGLMHEEALKPDEEPDRLSFLHSVRVVQRRIAHFAAILPSGEKSSAYAILDEILQERVVSSRNRVNFRSEGPRLLNVRTLRRSKQDSADARKGGLCKSYTALLDAVRKSFPTPIVIGRITVRSVKHIVL